MGADPNAHNSTWLDKLSFSAAFFSLSFPLPYLHPPTLLALEFLSQGLLLGKPNPDTGVSYCGFFWRIHSRDGVQAQGAVVHISSPTKDLQSWGHCRYHMDRGCSGRKEPLASNVEGAQGTLRAWPGPSTVIPKSHRPTADPSVMSFSTKGLNSLLRAVLSLHSKTPSAGEGSISPLLSFLVVCISREIRNQHTAF